ncbi:MAG TPA: hypothetical protein VL404_00490 [Candidatus Eisenbacteria bacterium]|nr:hypothetical protein [Candidatus Eisenbacteria bacterium]
MRRTIPLTLLILCFAAREGSAEWTSISRGLDETEIGIVAAHPRDPSTIYAASHGRLFRTENAGASWKRVLSLRGREASVRCVWISSEGQDVYVGSDKGLHRSRNGGKTWELPFKSGSSPSGVVYCVAQSPSAGQVWFGTGTGLFALDRKTGAVSKISSLGQPAVYSLAVTPEAAAALTEKGIFRSRDSGASWEKVYADRPDEETQTEETLEQFDIEEFALTPNLSKLIFFPLSGRYYAAGRKGVMEGSSDAGAWAPQPGQSLPTRAIHGLTGSHGRFYAATERGIFAWDPQASSYQDLSQGLDSLRVNDVDYSASGDYLVAATAAGVFRYAHPELKFEPAPGEAAPRTPDAGEFLSRFRGEPSVLEIQNAAIRYAEVHPGKIEAWRRAAARKALLPTLSVDADLDTDQNIDLDRGGTNDPDRFITGPDEKSSGWSVGVSWNLGDLIWNDDQTSIDTRSRLMVQLRDDVLSEVTHLYFERRRLQAASLMSPAGDLPLQVENELKLQEVTAKIDALTGGYLSARLAQNTHGQTQEAVDER